jgi:hypothetical protein
MKKTYTDWTQVSETKAIRLQNGRKVAVLVQLVDGELTYSAKRIDLLTEDEFNKVVEGCRVAAQYHARMVLMINAHQEKRFGTKSEIDSDILSLAADISVDDDKVQ